MASSDVVADKSGRAATSSPKDGSRSSGLIATPRAPISRRAQMAAAASDLAACERRAQLRISDSTKTE